MKFQENVLNGVWLFYLPRSEDMITEKHVFIEINPSNLSYTSFLSRLNWFYKQIQDKHFLESKITENTILFIQQVKNGYLFLLVDGKIPKYMQQLMKELVKKTENKTIIEIGQTITRIKHELFFKLFSSFLKEGVIFPFYMPVFNYDSLNMLFNHIQPETDSKELTLIKQGIQQLLKEIKVMPLKLMALYNLFIRSVEVNNEIVGEIFLQLLIQVSHLKESENTRFLMSFLKYYFLMVFNRIDDEENFPEDQDMISSVSKFPVILQVLFYRIYSQFKLRHLDIVTGQKALTSGINLFIKENVTAPTEQSFVFFLLGKINSFLKQYNLAFQYFNLALDFMFLIPKEEARKIQGLYLQEINQSLLDSFDGAFYLFNKDYFVEAEHYLLNLLLILFNYGILSTKGDNSLIRLKLHLLSQAIILKKEELRDVPVELLEFENFVLLFFEILTIDPVNDQKSWRVTREKLLEHIQKKLGLMIDLMFIFYNDGRLIYSYVDPNYKLKQAQDELFGGIISAINSVVKELTGEEGLKEIVIGSRILFVSKSQNFLLVVFTSNTKDQIKPFTDGLVHILKRYDPLYTNWYGSHNEIQPLVNEVEEYIKNELGLRNIERRNKEW